MKAKNSPNNKTAQVEEYFINKCTAVTENCQREAKNNHTVTI